MSKDLVIQSHPLARSKGFNLVELMITLAISSVLIGGIFSVYLNTKTTQRFSAANSRVQESGRFGLEYLKRDIRMIGYRGCISFDDPSVKIIANDMPADFGASQNELLGFEVSDGWAENSLFASADNITNRIKTGTDAFNIGRMASLRNKLAGNLTPDNANVQIESNPKPGIDQGDLIFVSDCSNADIFRVTNNPNANGNTITFTYGRGNNIANRLSKTYQGDANIAKYQSILYFVGDTGRTNAQNEKIYALYQAENNFNDATPNFTVEELIEGVENMQLLYGEVLANGNTRYLKAADVTDMTQVSSIQIGLLIASTNNVRQKKDASTYALLDENIGLTTTVNHGNDKRLRQTFSSTIQIRNRRL